MFKTMLEAELKPDHPNIGLGFQFWSCVELGYLWPWFQVEMVAEISGKLHKSVMFVPSLELFREMLRNISDEAWIEKVLLVSPATVNGSSEWQMDPLLKLVVVRGVNSVVIGYEYRVKDKTPFLIGESLDNVTPENVEVVYLAERHLGR